MNDKAIFIVGCPRSGTTILTEILNRHPDISITPETHYFSKFKHHLALKYMPLVKNKYDINKNFLFFICKNRLFFNIFSRKITYEKLLNELDNFPFFHDSKLEKDTIKSYIKEHRNTQLKPYHMVFKAWVSCYAKKYNKKIPGEKTPINVFYMKTIQKIFENACFIHIIRNPYSTIASMNKMPWSSSDSKRNAYLWKKYNDVSNNNLKNYYLLRFEELVEKPDIVLKDLFDNINVEYSNTVLEPSTNDRDYEANGEYWKKNSSKQISRKNISSDISNLSKDEIKAIKKTIGKKLFLKYGYDF